MRTILAAMLLGVFALGASAEPVTHPTQTEKHKPSQTPPTTLVIIACRVDDFTGQPGRQDPALAAKNWRDLEWRFDKGLKLQCKREVDPLEDSVNLNDQTGKIPPLNHDFSDFGQCAGAAIGYTPQWEEKNRGWAIMAVGCPVPIVDDRTGKVLSWKLPDCPRQVQGLTIDCLFDSSMI